jgi:hypothetical protein
MRALSVWLNDVGRAAADAGSMRKARLFYRLASAAAPHWSAPCYNLGLQAKYSGEWEQSRKWNQQAVLLNPKSEDAWWNLGIAATALHDWSEARRAWKAFGIDIPDGNGELSMNLGRACTRLDPNVAGEVVWGRRIDPARIVILNVPFPESNHRFGDIVLNDGAANGTRQQDGKEVPVFDELMLWKASDYSTMQVNLTIPDEDATQTLVDLCDENEMGIEDWSTVRILCAQCSRGNPGPHKCDAGDDELGRVAFAFAAKNEAQLAAVLGQWRKRHPRVDFGEIQMLLGTF